MSKSGTGNLEQALAEHTEEDWLTAVDGLRNSIHEVDRTAVRIWFRFYPLSLHLYLQEAEDREAAVRDMVLQGDFELRHQIDSSHRFLYGSRFWPQVKQAVIDRAANFTGQSVDLEEVIREVAAGTAKTAAVDESLTTAIAAVGLMTLRQSSIAEFSSTDGSAARPSGILRGSPEKVLERRASDPKRGFLDFLKTIDKEFRVYWDENDPKAAFGIIFDEEIASAAARDQSRDWLGKDDRCIEGVIPVECRSAACGTCWVGVIGGAENLTDVQRLERKQMKVFGYRQDDDPKPFMRLACQAAAEGSVSIVIPPWNGVFGKKVYGNVERVELEPATTAAARLRETINDVLEN